MTISKQISDIIQKIQLVRTLINGLVLFLYTWSIGAIQNNVYEPHDFVRTEIDKEMTVLTNLK